VKRYIITFAVILVMLVALGVYASCATSSSKLEVYAPLQSNESLEYVNATHGFSIRYPSSWSYIENYSWVGSSGSHTWQVMFREPRTQEEPLPTEVYIGVFSVSSGETLQSLVKESEAGSSVAPIENWGIKIGGVPSCIVINESSQYELSIKTAWAFILKGNTEYLIGYDSSGENFDTYLDTFYGMLGSLELN